MDTPPKSSDTMREEKTPQKSIYTLTSKPETRRIQNSLLIYCSCFASPGRLNRLCGLCPSSRPASLSANACAMVLGFGPFNFLGVDCFRFKMSCLFSKYRRLLTSLM